jgi:hypothetical protein
MKRRSRTKMKAPEALGNVLARAGEDRFAPSRAPMPPHVWLAAVGPRIAERTRPVAIEDGTLVVRVASSAWASELSLLSDALLARIRKVLAPGGPRVSALRFRVGQIEPPERPAELRRALVPAPVPLSPALTRALAKVQDEELRAAIEEAARVTLAWQHNTNAPKVTSAQQGARAPRDAGTGSDPPAPADSASRGASRGTRGDDSRRRS